MIPGTASSSVVRSYVTQSQPNSSALAEGLWVLPPDVLSSGDRAVLFDQYKLYAAEAERLSVRRTLTSAFFLVVNLGALVAGTALLANAPERPWLFSVALVAALGTCLGWFWIVRSYRQMASGKYSVITHLEKQLPAAPGVAEWSAVGLGRDSSRYLPMSNVEVWAPALFAVCHLATYGLLYLP
ncbi:MAG: RipA family octameric membrane protein [Actinomycetes bacterium]